MLGGYTSALLLVGVVLVMAYECVTRLMHPMPIAYDQALAVATLGLLVNVISAWMLASAAHGHDHDHDHDHGHDNGHQDQNLRSAYLHVAADAATSLLAIGALAGGKYLQLTWLDAGLACSGPAWSQPGSGHCCARRAACCSMPRWTRRWWARSAAPCASPRSPLSWRICMCGVGKGKYACILSVTAGDPATPEYFRSLQRAHRELVHVTVEVNRPAVA